MRSTAITKELRSVTLMDTDGNPVHLSYVLARSQKRHSYSIVISQDGTVTFHIPAAMRDADIQNILQEKGGWILASRAQQLEKRRQNPASFLSPEEQAVLRRRGTRLIRPAIAEAIARYAPLLPSWHRRITKISIRSQRTRWGSCSIRGTLSFNWKLANAPKEALEYVVVHELCHLCYMDHSRNFWNLVEQLMPDYRRWRKWLRDNGHTLG
jgi:predicted metal-dependent hydrolase